jgi:hypothetical protein
MAERASVAVIYRMNGMEQQSFGTELTAQGLG